MSKRIKYIVKPNPVGRPTLMTEITIKKLEEIFAIGGTDKEACLFANVSEPTLYSYQLKHPEFVDRKEELRQQPVLKARRTVVDNLGEPEMAFRYLERKRKNEFSPRQESHVTGDITVSQLLNTEEHDRTGIEQEE